MLRVTAIATAVVMVVATAPAAWAEDRDSLRWAGYTSEVDEGSFDSVSARWAVPGIECERGEIDTELAVWIGLDGVGNDLVEQVGTTSECDGDGNGEPAYYAWAEAFPAPAVRLFKVEPGDVIQARVGVADGRFTFTVHNLTRDKQDGDNWPTDGKGRSAEAVVEAPPGKRLPEFAPITLTRVRVDGEPIGDLDPDRVTLVRAGQPRVVRAEPSALSDSGKRFTVEYRNP